MYDKESSYPKYQTIFPTNRGINYHFGFSLLKEDDLTSFLPEYRTLSECGIDMTTTIIRTYSSFIIDHNVDHKN